MAKKNFSEAVAEAFEGGDVDELRVTATELGKLKVKYDSMLKSYGELQTKHSDLEGKFTQVCREGVACRDKLYTVHDAIDELTIKVDDLMQEQA